jgi:predicted branched-subunit amino acid permease
MSEPFPSAHEKEEQWRKDAYAFGFAVVKHWYWWTGATIGSGVVAIWQATGKGGGRLIPSSILWLVVTGGIVVACFRAFCDQ